MTRRWPHFPLRGVGLALLLAGCSSSSDRAAGLEEAPPAASSPGSPATDPAAGPTATSSTPGQPTVTSVRVHYGTTPAIKPGDLGIRGSAGPLSWDKSLTLIATAAGLYTWSSADVKTDLEVKPLLGETWSRGPN